MFVMFQMFHFGFLQVLDFKVMFQCSNVPKKYGPVTGEVEEGGMAKRQGDCRRDHSLFQAKWNIIK